jgi:transposase
MCSTDIVVPFRLTPSEKNQLVALSQSRTEEARLVQRAKIVLLCADGKSHARIARQLGTTRKTVKRWHERFVVRRQAEPEKPVRAYLADADREGAPPRIAEEAWVDILALCTTDPTSLGLPFSHWSTRELERQVIERKILPRIDHSTIHRFLSAADVKPHQVRGWMNRKDDPEFAARAEQVKQVLCEAAAGTDPTHAVLSYDEKSGMQANQRLHPDRPMSPGRPLKQEYEYRRHGTLTLLCAMLCNVGTVMGICNGQRTNLDTAAVLHLFLGLCRMQGFTRITVVLDQLNTHMSLELVQAVAARCGLKAPSAEQLDTSKKRRAWLERTDKPIVFVFTPVHASWLNPVEMWFSVLSRRLLRRSSFHSTQDLSARIQEFITYYNLKLAHPYSLRLWRPKAAGAHRPYRGSAPCVSTSATLH